MTTILDLFPRNYAPWEMGAFLLEDSTREWGFWIDRVVLGPPRVRARQGNICKVLTVVMVACPRHGQHPVALLRDALGEYSAPLHALRHPDGTAITYVSSKLQPRAAPV